MNPPRTSRGFVPGGMPAKSSDGKSSASATPHNAGTASRVARQRAPRVLDARQALLPIGTEQDITLTHDTFARKAARGR